MKRVIITLILSTMLTVLAASPGYPSSAEEWLDKGKEQTSPQAQIECFTKAILLNPELAEAYILRAAAYSDLGSYDKAVADYTRVIVLNPENAQAYHNRGWAYEQLGNYARAVADFTAAIKIDTHYSSAYNNRGVAYYQLGRVSEALADFDKACKLGYAAGCQNYYKVK